MQVRVRVLEFTDSAVHETQYVLDDLHVRHFARLGDFRSVQFDSNVLEPGKCRRRRTYPVLVVSLVRLSFTEYLSFMMKKLSPSATKFGEKMSSSWFKMGGVPFLEYSATDGRPFKSDTFFSVRSRIAFCTTLPLDSKPLKDSGICG